MLVGIRHFPAFVGILRIPTADELHRSTDTLSVCFVCFCGLYSHQFGFNVLFRCLKRVIFDPCTYRLMASVQ